MNFFRKKRKHEDEEETSEQPPAKKPTRANRLLSWIKEKFKKSGSQDQETPVHRRTVRYVMTPQEAFSPSAVASDVRNQQFYELHSVVNVTESKNYEFKAAGGRYPTQVLPEHIRKYGSAFLNSSGGVLLAGILDNGVVQGVPYISSEYKRLILRTIDGEFRKFRPSVSQKQYSVTFVPVIQSYPHCYPRVLQNTYVIEIFVREGTMGEVYEDGLHKVYVRREGSVEGPLSPIKIKELVLQNIKEAIPPKKRKWDESQDSNTPTEQAIKKKVKISPITFDLNKQ